MPVDIARVSEHVRQRWGHIASHILQGGVTPEQERAMREKWRAKFREAVKTSEAWAAYKQELLDRLSEDELVEMVVHQALRTRAPKQEEQ